MGGPVVELKTISHEDGTGQDRFVFVMLPEDGAAASRDRAHHRAGLLWTFVAGIAAGAAASIYALLRARTDKEL